MRVFYLNTETENEMWEALSEVGVVTETSHTVEIPSEYEGEESVFEEVIEKHITCDYSVIGDVEGKWFFNVILPKETEFPEYVTVETPSTPWRVFAGYEEYLASLVE